jgi:hypothetical protein
MTLSSLTASTGRPRSEATRTGRSVSDSPTDKVKPLIFNTIVTSPLKIAERCYRYAKKS